MSERAGAVIARNTLLALLLGAVLLLVLPRGPALGWSYVDTFTIAFSFAAMGWVAERLLLWIPGIDTPGGRAIRVTGWFAAGLWAYLLGRIAWRLYGRDPAELPALVWGGVFLVGLELVLHAGLAARGEAGFFKRTG
jgi:hypothetical protein